LDTYVCMYVRVIKRRQAAGRVSSVNRDRSVIMNDYSTVLLWREIGKQCRPKSHLQQKEISGLLA